MPVESQHNGVAIMPPAADPLANALEQLFIRRRQIQKDAERLDKMIENLQTLQQGQPEAAIPPAKEQEFKGAKPLEALAAYLRARRGVRIALSRAIEDMIRGGLAAGQSRGKQDDPAALIAHVIKIGMPQKVGTFQWEPVALRGVPPENITVWIAEDAPPKKKPR